jgi:hypothetical protein
VDICLQEQEGGGRNVWNLRPGSFAAFRIGSQTRRAKFDLRIRVWLPRFFHALAQWEKEVFSFPSSRFNDQVDAFSWALSWIFRIQRARRADAAFDRRMQGFSLFH